MAKDYTNNWDSINAEAVVFQIFKSKMAKMEQQSEQRQMHSSNVSLARGVLQKLMYLCDFGYYGATGRYLTRETYIHGRNGPIPIHFDMVMDELITDERVSMTANGEYRCSESHPLERRPRSLDDAECETIAKVNDDSDLDDLAYHTLPKLEDEQVSIINVVVERYSDLKPSELESICKNECPWQIVSNGQIIDYRAAYYRED